MLVSHVFAAILAAAIVAMAVGFLILSYHLLRAARLSMVNMPGGAVLVVGLLSFGGCNEGDSSAVLHLGADLVAALPAIREVESPKDKALLVAGVYCSWREQGGAEALAAFRGLVASRGAGVPVEEVTAAVSLICGLQEGAS